MEPEEKQKLERALQLAEDNNRILSKMHRSMQWGRIFKAVYWIIIIGVSLGLFYFIQPIIDAQKDFLRNGTETINQVPEYLNTEQDSSVSNP